MHLRVVASADDVLRRDRLIADLEALDECEVVASGPTADDDLTGLPADVAVWDVGPERPAARAQFVHIGETDLPVLILGPIGLAAEALAAGAGGYLRRDVSALRLRAALEAVALRLQVADPDPAPVPPPDGALVEDLTPREVDVLQLLAEGLPNKEIARRLRISEHTVKYHVNTLLAKLGARTRTEAVTRAVRLGLIIL